MRLRPEVVFEHIPFCPNFRWKEALYVPGWEIYAFPDYEQYKNILAVAEIMEQIRKALGNKPIKVTSWLRPKVYNDKINGAWLSGHIYGMAVDFRPSNMGCDEARQRLLPELDKLKIRMEDKPGSDWVHIDTKMPQNGRRFFKP